MADGDGVIPDLIRDPGNGVTDNEVGVTDSGPAMTGLEVSSLRIPADL